MILSRLCKHFKILKKKWIRQQADVCYSVLLDPIGK